MDSELSEKFSCPICFEIPEREILQCKNGHTVCFRCGNSLTECPQCRVVMETPKIRCRALEELLDMMKFDCANKASGCPVILSRNKIQSHAKDCQFGCRTVKLCEHFGFRCGFAISNKSLPQAIAHLNHHHNFAICRDTEININLENFGSINSRQNSMWTPVAVDMTERHNRIILLINQISNTDSSLSLTCLELGGNILDTEAKTDFKVNFTITAANSNKKPNIAWSLEPIEAKYVEAVLNDSIPRFPIELLKNHYLQDGVLTIKCSIDTTSTHAAKEAHNVPKSVHIFNCPRNHNKQAATTSLPLTIRQKSTNPNRSTNSLQGAHQCSNVATSSQRRVKKTHVFVNATCDHCKTGPIVGTRFKCLQCRDYDLCKSCVNARIHSHHCFVMIQNAEQNMFIMQRWNECCNADDLPSNYHGLTSSFTWNSSYLTCNRCPNEKKYICLDCASLVGYCDNCFRTVAHVESHCFAVTDTVSKLGFVISLRVQSQFNALETLRLFTLTFL